MELTQETLRQLLHYDPETGVFTWLESRGRVKKGSVAGNQSFNGCKLYVSIRILRKLYRAHQLVWLYMMGDIPPEIDHINGDGTDNRWCNLREVTRQENCRNHRLRSNNLSGVCGVHWDPVNNKWRAEIGLSGKGVKLGRFSNFFDAVCARKSAENRLGFHANHGSDRPL